MKSLYLLRHAKSSWDNPGLSDIDRPLNPRGERDAPRMGKALGARLQPMTFHVSPAKRAQSTFRNLQLQWPGLTAEHGVTVAALYTFDYRSLMKWIAQQASDLSDLAIVGHNPALTDLTNYLVGYGALANIPTAGWVELTLELRDWADIPQFGGRGQLSYRLFPRELQEAS